MAATNPIRVVYAASATGAQEALSIDWRDQVPSGYSFEVQFNGAAAGSVTIQSTLDDINDPTITPDWITETVAITADTRGIIAHPVTAVRVNIGSLAGGTLTFKLLGGSLIGDVTGLVIPGGGGGPSSNVNLAQVGGTTVVTAGVAGLLAVGGNVAAGVADAGNPVKVGGFYTNAPVAAAVGSRTNLLTGPYGVLAVASGNSSVATDGFSNTLAFGLGLNDNLGSRLSTAAGYVFNGATWDRQRGTTLGAYTIGPDADNAVASVGANPVPVGGIYSAAPPTYGDQDRTQFQTNINGQMLIAVSSTLNADGQTNSAALRDLGGTQRPLAIAAYVSNGTTWDRARGDTGGSYVKSNFAFNAPVSVTRPANTTPYSAGDVVGGAITFTNMGPSAGRILLTSTQLELDIASIPAGMTSFFLALYSVTPPSAIADNAQFNLPAGDRPSFLGIVQLGSPADLVDTLYVEQNIINKQIKLAGTSLFGYLVTVGGFTPAANSEVYVVSLHSVGVSL